MFTGTGMFSYLLVSVLVVIPFWKIFRKAGFNPALSFLAVVPIANLMVLYYVAFSRWKSE